MPLSQMRADPAWDRAQVATPLESQEIFLVGQIARCDEKLTSKTCYNYSSSFSFDVLLSFASYRASCNSLLSYFSPFFPRILSFSLFALSVSFFYHFLFYHYRAVCHFVCFFIRLSCFLLFFACHPRFTSPFFLFLVPFYCHYLTLLFYFQTFFDLTWLALFLLVLTFLSYFEIFEIFFFQNLLLYTDK